MRRFVIIPIRTMRIFPGQWFSTCESSVKGKIIEKFCVNRIICILMMEFCFGGAGSLFAIICFNFWHFEDIEAIFMVINSKIMLLVHDILIWKSFVVLYGGLQG